MGSSRYSGLKGMGSFSSMGSQGYRGLRVCGGLGDVGNLGGWESRVCGRSKGLGVWGKHTSKGCTWPWYIYVMHSHLLNGPWPLTCDSVQAQWYRC